MALTGLVLVLFVMGHMLGNLQIFLGPDVINAYAYKLHHLLPVTALWAVRLVLLGTIAVHIWAAVTLTLDNRKARPQGYLEDKVVQASYSSRTMRMSGIILLAFIIFHIAHFTVRAVPGMQYESESKDESESKESGRLEMVKVPLVKDGEAVLKNGHEIMTFNVNDMMVAGFKVWWVSAFYIIATGLLCMHLTHGFSSMFQSVGLRNGLWRKRLDRAALAYGWVVFIGFAIIPIAVMAGLLKQDPTGGLVSQVGETAAIIESLEK
ncbi:MAG: succinate dehydrogenase cytochrome b subunit [Puniceicoccaceae bacterium]|nr:succinate dehydrogenase cytochrome b subunit [Puniceicoccaceae bacterium]